MTAARVFPEPSVCVVGSLPPSGYVEWHDWAAAQHRGGLRQTQQPCGHWLFPQEIGVHWCPRCSTSPQEAKRD